MLNFLLEVIDVGVIGDAIGEDNIPDGYVYNSNSPIEVIGFIIIVFVLLAIGFFVGFTIAKWLYKNDESDDE